MAEPVQKEVEEGKEEEAKEEEAVQQAQVGL
jgi:hypothetical protein